MVICFVHASRDHLICVHSMTIVATDFKNHFQWGNAFVLQQPNRASKETAETWRDVLLTYHDHTIISAILVWEAPLWKAVHVFRHFPFSVSFLFLTPWISGPKPAKINDGTCWLAEVEFGLFRFRFHAVLRSGKPLFPRWSLKLAVLGCEYQASSTLYVTFWPTSFDCISNINA